MKSQFEPYQLALMSRPAHSTRKRPVQVISRPIPNKGLPDTIKVRMVPGDPTTMHEVLVSDLEPFYKGKRWYVHIARVYSSFPFPEDMLRYDDCYLYDHNLVEHGMTRFTGPVLVVRVSQRAQPLWTSGRWLSFCCRIEHAKTYNMSKPDSVLNP